MSPNYALMYFQLSSTLAAMDFYASVFNSTQLLSSDTEAYMATVAVRWLCLQEDTPCLQEREARSRAAT